MPILNYTTKIEAVKTAGEVQTILAKAGATAVAMKFGSGGRPVAIAFAARTPFGEREFTLPIFPEKVLAVLLKQRVARSLATHEQAERVAWRILKDWVEAQLAIIQTEMVTIDQVMLPYMRNGDDGETVFEQYQAGQQLLLEGK